MWHTIEQQVNHQSRRGWRRLWTAVLLLLVACSGDTTNTVGCEDICVGEPFKAFYEEEGGARILGDPYTDMMRLTLDDALERQVQYFDRGRLELVPQTGEIVISELGEWAYAGLNSPTPADVPESGRERHFPETGLYIRGAFLEFYEDNNGSLWFGSPISQQLIEGELRVQYFQNARLEWHPEAPAGQQIQVGLLGRAHYLYEVYEPNVVAQPIDRDIDSVKISAAVQSPILYAGDDQTVSVKVETQDRQPLSGVSVNLTITHDGREVTQSVAAETDRMGTIQTVLDLPELTPGKPVEVIVEAIYLDRPIGTTVITFQTWW